MDMCQKFFSFYEGTSCGYPYITLDGTHQDWKNLSLKAKEILTKRCTKEFAEWWMEALIPLLDKVADEYKLAELGKDIDARFWNSLCKIGGTYGSGDKTWFNGWINILCPFTGQKDNKKRNKFCQAYDPNAGYAKQSLNQMKFGEEGVPFGVEGPDIADFPSGISSAPVTWDYQGEKVELSFKAGFVGATQDKETGCLKPLVGWYITKKEE